MKTLWLYSFWLFSFCTLACGPSPAHEASATFPPTPLAVREDVDSRWRIELRTAPTPPPRGPFDAELRVIDRQGNGVDGLEVRCVPWMPAMSHGSNRPVTRPVAGGRYVVDDVLVSMAGRWQLRVSMTDPEGRTVETRFDIDVP
jgi:hypothetical protein